MAIKPDIQPLLNLPYSYDHGPASRPEVITEGINCQLLAHLVLEKLIGIRLSDHLRSREIYLDDRHFIKIQPDKSDIGDIFLFGRALEQDPSRLHLAIFIDRDSNNYPILIHSTRVEGRVALWPLEKFLSHPKYQILFGIRRYTKNL